MHKKVAPTLILIIGSILLGCATRLKPVHYSDVQLPLKSGGIILPISYSDVSESIGAKACVWSMENSAGKKFEIIIEQGSRFVFIPMKPGLYESKTFYCASSKLRLEPSRYPMFQVRENCAQDYTGIILTRENDRVHMDPSTKADIPIGSSLIPRCK